MEFVEIIMTSKICRFSLLKLIPPSNIHHHVLSVPDRQYILFLPSRFVSPYRSFPRAYLYSMQRFLICHLSPHRNSDNFRFVPRAFCYQYYANRIIQSWIPIMGTLKARVKMEYRWRTTGTLAAKTINIRNGNKHEKKIEALPVRLWQLW